MREQANIAEVAGAFAKLEEHYRAEKKEGTVEEFGKNKQTQLRRLEKSGCRRTPSYRAI